MGGLRALACASLVSLAWGCGGDEESAPEAPATASAVAPPGSAAPTATPSPTPPPAVAEVVAVEDGGVDAGPTRPEVIVPPYAETAAACVPHPELAEAVPTSLRDLSRGTPEFPEASAINAACAHAPAELADNFNRGGLRRHRSRDYVQSEHYFAQALISDASQLSPRYNLACAMARQDAFEMAIDQLRQLSEAGPEGQAYADRAHTDADFGAYHNHPMLAGLLRGQPPSILALANPRDSSASNGDEEAVVELRDGVVVLDDEQVWQSGVLDAMDFQAAVLALEPDRRRFSFFSARPSAAVTEALSVIGMRLLGRPSGWTPDGSTGFLILAVSSRDEDRHTLYLSRVVDASTLEPMHTIELPPQQCADGVEAIRLFAVTTDHRAFGTVNGCLGDDPHTFRRCLVYWQEGAVRERCGQGTAPAAPAEVVPAPAAE